MYLRELITLIGFEVDVAGFNSAEKAFAELVGLAKGLLGGLRDLVVESTGLGRSLDNMAFKLGVSVEQMQKLNVVAAETGVSQQSLQASMLQLMRRASDATTGNTAFAKSFAQVGLRGAELKGLLADPNALLGVVAGKIAAASTASERSALAFRLMGRGGAELLPVMRDLSPALAGVNARTEEFRFLTQEQTNELKAGAAEVARASAIWDGLKNQIALALLPTVRKGIAYFEEWLVKHKDLIDNGVRKLGDAFHYAAGEVKSFYGYFEANPIALASFSAVIAAQTIPTLVRLAAVLAPVGGYLLVATAIAAVIAEIAYHELGLPNFFDDLVAKAEKLKSEGKSTWISTLVLGLAQLSKAIDETVQNALGALDKLFHFSNKYTIGGGVSAATYAAAKRRGQAGVDVLNKAVAKDALDAKHAPIDEQFPGFRAFANSHYEGMKNGRILSPEQKTPGFGETAAKFMITPIVNVTINGGANVSKEETESFITKALKPYHDTLLQTLHEVAPTQSH